MAERLDEAFRQQAEAALARYPRLVHEWQSEPEGVRLRFPAADADGFEVKVVATSASIIVYALGAHEHFESGSEPPARIAAAALGLVRDLLSPDMRIRERASASRPYKWFIESLRGTTWQLESQTGLLVFNYLGARSERTYQNRHLPGRLGSAS